MIHFKALLATLAVLVVFLLTTYIPIAYFMLAIDCAAVVGLIYMCFYFYFKRIKK